MIDKNITSPKILIINPFGIGDVLFTTPLISNLKNHWPDCWIGYLANRRTAVFLSGYPKVDRVFVYERDAFLETYHRSKGAFIREMNQFAQTLRQERFDCVIDLSLNSSFNFLTWFLGIKKRIGFNYKNRSYFLTTKIALKGYEGRHVVEYYLSLLEPLGLTIRTRQLELPVKKEEEGWADAVLAQSGISSKRLLVGLIPGGGASWGKDATYKRWPAEKYAKLADKIVEKFSATIILMGDSNEEELCHRVAGLMTGPSIQFCGKTTIGQCAALLKRCQLNVVNDGGPLHIAVAVGAKTISIFGPVDDQVYGPYPLDQHLVVKNDIACRPCYRRFRMARCSHHNCLTNINVEDVFRKVEQLL